jgi:hypothetical protein
MENNKNIRMIRGISYYLPRALKFYNLKNETLTPAIFLITLVIYFFGSYFISGLLPDLITALNEFISISNSNRENLGSYNNLLQTFLNSSFINLIVSIITNFLVGVFSSVFLITYIKELKGEVFPTKSGFKLLSHKFFKIAVLSLLFSLGYNILKMFLVLPGFIYYSVYLFYMCYALDLKMRIGDAFEASKTITKGHRMEIFSVVILFKVIAFLSVYFLTTIVLSLISSIFSAESNSWVQIFVSAFMSSIRYLMEIKLVAMIYFDLEYGWETIDKI